MPEKFDFFSYQVTAKSGLETGWNGLETVNTLDTAQLVSQSYDFASNMSGVYNGAQQKLQEIVGHGVPYMPCLSHRSNTVVEHACKASAIITDMFVILESLFTFFTSSTKR